MILKAPFWVDGKSVWACGQKAKLYRKYMFHFLPFIYLFSYFFTRTKNSHSQLLFFFPAQTHKEETKLSLGTFENVSRRDNIHHSASLSWWSRSSGWQSTALSLEHCTSLRGSIKSGMHSWDMFIFLEWRSSDGRRLSASGCWIVVKQCGRRASVTSISLCRYTLLVELNEVPLSHFFFTTR